MGRSKAARLREGQEIVEAGGHSPRISSTVSTEMKCKILLTGKNGQVGSELLRLLPRLGEVTALGREQMDLARPDQIRKVIGEVRPNLIVNAAAYTAVDQAEKEEHLAQAINAEAPALIA